MIGEVFVPLKEQDFLSSIALYTSCVHIPSFFLLGKLVSFLPLYLALTMSWKRGLESLDLINGRIGSSSQVTLQLSNFFKLVLSFKCS